MEEAEARIIEYERRIPREADPAKAAKMRESIENLLDAAKADLAMAINAFNNHFKATTDRDFNTDIVGRKTGPVGGLYPFLNDIIRTCREIAEIGRLPEYRDIAKALKRFADGEEAIRKNLLNGDLSTRELTVVQCVKMQKEVLQALKKAGFTLPDVVAVA